MPAICRMFCGFPRAPDSAIMPSGFHLSDANASSNARPIRFPARFQISIGHTRGQ